MSEDINKGVLRNRKKALKNLGKWGMRTDDVIEAQIGQDRKNGKNATGVIYVTSGGMVGFTGNIAGRYRRYVFAKGEIVAWNLTVGKLFGVIEIETSYTKLVIDRIEKRGAALIGVAMEEVVWS